MTTASKPPAPPASGERRWTVHAFDGRGSEVVPAKDHNALFTAYSRLQADYNATATENGDLRVRLAEAEALLQHMHDFGCMNCEHGTQDDGHDFLKRTE